ncbi:MAG: hypothetical protein Q7S28_00550 [bacterium]|nr:hypothetical protein [bacterium]
MHTFFRVFAAAMILLFTLASFCFFAKTVSGQSFNESFRYSAIFFCGGSIFILGGFAIASLFVFGRKPKKESADS